MQGTGSEAMDSVPLSNTHPDDHRLLKKPQEKNAILGDKFEMGEELGRGAYGQVFKGTDIRTGNVVAIKQISLAGMSNDNLLDIMTEIDLLKNLNHKNIVKYIGSYKTRSHLFIILEYMEQGALSQLIKANRYGVLSEPIVAAYISQVLQGLQYLHAQGVVHRDIKGANILMGSEGQVKLADFGVATRRDANVDDFDPVGTPYWMAPEVIEMMGGTAAADIWSVGCLIIELLTGYPPYFELQPMSALYRIVQDPNPPLPASISDSLRSFLLRCFQKDPQDRPSAAELLSDPWLLSSRSSLRSSWNKAAGFAHRGLKPREAHETVQSVVRRILAAESSDGSAGGEAPADASQRGAAAAPGPLEASAELMRRSSGEAVARTSSGASLHAPSPYALLRGPGPAISPAVAGTAAPGSRGADPRPTADAGAPSPSGAEASRNASELRADSIKLRFPDEAGTTYDPTRTPSARPSGAPHETSAASHSSAPSSRAYTPLTVSPEPPDIASYGLPAVSLASMKVSTTPILAGMIGGLPGSGGPALKSQLEPMLDDLIRQGQTSPAPEDPVRQQGSAIHTPASHMSAQPNYVSAGLAFGVNANAVVELDGDDARRRQESGEIRRLVAVLHNVQQQHSVGDMVSACATLCDLVRGKPDYKAYFLGEAGIIALMELLQQPQDNALLQAALELLLSVIHNDAAVLESLCLVGIVPIVNVLTGRSFRRSIRNAAASFVAQLCRTSVHTVQMFVACGGVPVLVGMLEADFAVDSALITAAMESVWCVLQVHGPTPVNHFCRLFAKAGLVPHLLPSVKSMCVCAAALGSNVLPQGHSAKLSHDAATWAGAKPAPREAGNGHRVSHSWPGPDAARSAATLSRLLEQACKLLLVLSYSDSVVKSHVCQPTSLRTLLGTMQELPSAALLHKALVAVKNLTGDPQVLRHMQEADAVALLVDFLRRGTIKSNVVIGTAEKLEIVQALHNLCKMSKERQAQAAGAGITPLLCQMAERTQRPGQLAPHRKPAAAPPANEADTLGKIRNLCIRLLCTLAHSNSKTRSELWACQGLDLFIDLLKEPAWRRQAMDALATWLMEDTQRVEPKLLVKSNIQIVVDVFRSSSGPQEALLELFDRMLNCSAKLSIAFGQSDLPLLMVQKLDNADAFLTGHVLDVIQSLYESHQRPKEFILRYNMKAKLERVMKKHPSAVKVVNKCETLLRAIHVASVL